MKKIDLGQSVSLLANLGVILGIVFLAVELRQNNALLAAESRATIVALNTEIWAKVIDTPDVAGLAVKDRSGESLTNAEELRLNALWVRSL